MGPILSRINFTPVYSIYLVYTLMARGHQISSSGIAADLQLGKAMFQVFCISVIYKYIYTYIYIYIYILYIYIYIYYMYIYYIINIDR